MRRRKTMSEKNLTGYPSIDKPWLKYYSEKAINAELPKCSMYEYMYENNKSYKENVAIDFYGHRISFSELFSNVECTAKAFVAAGITEGDVVAICSMTLPEIIYSIYALNIIGAVANMIDPRTNIERLKIYLDTSKTKLVVAIDKCISKIQKLKDMGFQGEFITVSSKDSLSFSAKVAYSIRNPETYILGKTWKQFIAAGNHVSYQKAEYKADTPAVIVYTGGTTGIPKGAVLSNDALNALAFQGLHIGIEYERGHKLLNIMPPFIAYGIACGIHMPMILGLTNVIIPLLDPDKLADLICEHKPTVLVGVPMHYEKLADSSKLENVDLSFLTFACCGGDGMNEQTEMKLNSFLLSHNAKYKIAKGYGMTEVTSAAVNCNRTTNKPGSIGIPLCRTTLAVFEPGTEKELPYNCEGELCISTSAMMLGYLENERETKNVRHTHSDGTTWIHSGDIGYIDEDGFVYIKGRMKRMIIRPDGHNVWPAQIENIIMENATVDSCAVVGKSDKVNTSGKWPVAFIVLKNEHKGDSSILSAIEQHCTEKIPPRDTVEFYEIDNLPFTDIGKIDYRTLEQMAEKENDNE